nr:hypothetical protein Iba_chr05bCG8880 [Ipomoea batatas]GMC98206.1 hypothetical protein Iba_chr05dCG14360 [Ipomoea batatas]
MVLMLLHGLALGNRSKIVKMSYGGLKTTPAAADIHGAGHEYEQSSRTGLALVNGEKIVKMMSYGGMKATAEAVAVNPLNGHEYEQSSRTVIGPPSPKANALGHQDFAPPPIVSLVMTVVKMSYGGVKATADMGPLYGHEYKQSLRTVRGLPPSPKPNHLHHQFVPAPPPLLSGVMGSKLFPRPPPPRRLLL